MITKNNKEKTIEISFNDKISTSANESGVCFYTFAAPTITCSSYADAKRMQTKLNEFIYKTTNEFLK